MGTSVEFRAIFFLPYRTRSEKSTEISVTRNRVRKVGNCGKVQGDGFSPPRFAEPSAQQKMRKRDLADVTR